MKAIADNTFEIEVLKSRRPLVLMFHATWSPASELALKLLADVADNFEGLVEPASLNVDENPLTPALYAVDSLPTLLVFRNGRVTKKIGPAYDRSDVLRLFELAISED